MKSYIVTITFIGNRKDLYILVEATSTLEAINKVENDYNDVDDYKAVEIDLEA